MKKIFKIKGLDCANCATQLENALQKIEEIQSVSISFMMERMVIEYEDQQEDIVFKKIKKIIKKEEPDVIIKEI